MDWGFHEAFLLWSKKECFLQWEPSTAGITFAEMWWNSHHWRFSRCNGAGCKIILFKFSFSVKSCIWWSVSVSSKIGCSLILWFCYSMVLRLCRFLSERKILKRLEISEHFFTLDCEEESCQGLYFFMDDLKASVWLISGRSRRERSYT